MGVNEPAASRPSGRIRARPEDFCVEEVGAFEPSGQGEHIAAWVVKQGVDHQSMVRRIAQQLGVPPSKVSWAGTKDRVAVTHQWITIHAPDAVLPALDEEDLSLHQVTRHDRRIRLGQVIGNRFRICIRDIDPLQAPRLHRQLQALQSSGLANKFMEQRFGHRGANPTMGGLVLRADWDGVLSAWLGLDGPSWSGEEDERRHLFADGRFAHAAHAWPSHWAAERRALQMLADGKAAQEVVQAIPRPMRRYWTDSVQSAVFNDIVDQRDADGTLRTVVDGDITWTHDRFLAAIGEPEDAMPASATGPLWGRKMRRASGAIDAMELEAGHRRGLTDDMMFGAAASAGSRRPLVVPVAQVSAGAGFDDHGPLIEVSFVLPKGCYATAVIDELIDRGGS